MAHAQEAESLATKGPVRVESIAALSAAEPIPLKLHCMEIWGGNEAAESAISVAGMDAWVYARPWRNHDNGGDIHYVSMCGAGKLARFVIADVSGHGDDASRLSEHLRNLMRKNVNTPDQARFTRALNTEFGAAAQGGLFATALLATYFAPTHHLIVCNAGHPRPLWYQAETNRWSLLAEDAPVPTQTVANLPLGVIEPTEYTQFAVPLAPGDLIVVYTDSLMEALDASGSQLGEDGLLRLAAAARASDPDPMNLGPALLRAIDGWRHADEADDDVTLLVLHHNGEDPPPLSLAERIRVTAKMLGARLSGLPS